jgi:hypothetical protein
MPISLLDWNRPAIVGLEPGFRIFLTTDAMFLSLNRHDVYSLLTSIILNVTCPVTAVRDLGLLQLAYYIVTCWVSLVT